MKPLFTIHEGEYLVGNHLEQNVYKKKEREINVWLPSKDTGIDLLVTDKETNKKSVSLQVKFSKDFYVTGKANDPREDVICSGFWTIDPKKLATSPADFWVLVLFSFYKGSASDKAMSANSHGKNLVQYVVISPNILEKKLAETERLAKRPSKTYHPYLTVQSQAATRCLNTRGFSKADREEHLVNQVPVQKDRDFTDYLNNWDQIFAGWN